MLDMLRTILVQDGLENVWVIMMAVLIVIGVLYCAAGYKLLRGMIALNGFLLGSLISLLVFQMTTTMAQWLMIVLSIAIGVAAAILSYVLFRLGLFLFVAVSGFFVVGSMLGTFMQEEQFWIMFGIALAAGVLAGIGAFIFSRQIIIVVTALGGGWLAAEALLAGILYEAGTLPVWLLWTVSVVFMLLGCWIQFRVTAKGVEHLIEGK